MLRQRLSERFFKEPYVFNGSNSKEEVPVWSEWKISICALILSLIVLTVKFFSIYGVFLEKTFLEQKLITYQVFSQDGSEMVMYTWKTAAKYSNIWLPLLCGILSSYFTWVIVILDSDVFCDGPVSPSLKMYKDQSGNTFYLNYMFAIIIGLLVASYMYLKGASIIY